MRVFGRAVRFGSLLFCAAAVAACAGGGDSAGTGTLSISLMDRPVDGVTELHVTISELWLKPRGDGPAFELPMTTSPLRVNLLELDDGNAAVLVDNAVVPADAYNWLEMRIEDDDLSDAYAITETGGMEPVQVDIRVPSGRIRLVSGFDVGANQGVEFLFDWDVRKGLTDPVGQDGFLLRPAFRMLDAREYGAISGTISTTTVTTEGSCSDDDADLNVGNVVYVFDGFGVVPDEIDETDGPDAEPLTTVDASFNNADGYDYRVVLMPGEYTLAFTCEGKNDTDDLDGGIEFLTTTHEVLLTAETEAIDIDF